MKEQSARSSLAGTAGEGVEQRCALQVQHGARALTYRRGERADASNIPTSCQGLG